MVCLPQLLVLAGILVPVPHQEEPYQLPEAPQDQLRQVLIYADPVAGSLLEHLPWHLPPPRPSEERG